MPTQWPSSRPFPSPPSSRTARRAPACTRQPYVGQAKRSKLLHLKRPWLVPIADTRVAAAYHDRSGAWADQLGIASGHWEAAREDLTTAASDFEWLTGQLRDHQEPRIQRLSRLTSLRLLDILAWTIGGT
jgi:hypothetical protein